jgi:hypothetical protein
MKLAAAEVAGEKTSRRHEVIMKQNYEPDINKRFSQKDSGRETRWVIQLQMKHRNQRKPVCSLRYFKSLTGRA